MNIDALNRKVYNAPRVVKSYSIARDLHAAERTVLDILRARLCHMRMLDLGVGAGRTAYHFSPLVKSYTGIDLSANMVQACRQAFPTMIASFSEGDARSMPQFKDASFDLVLFSFNGLDYSGNEDRSKALKEIRRVGSPGGSLFFSSHNLRYLPRYLNVPVCLNLFHQLKLLRRRNEVKACLDTAKKQGYAIVRDGGEGFSSLTYYIDPAHQSKVLKEQGFTNVRIFSESTGLEIDGEPCDQDRWLYYLCQM